MNRCARSFLLTAIVGLAAPVSSAAQSTGVGANLHTFVGSTETFASPDLGGRLTVPGGPGAGISLGLGAREVLFTAGFARTAARGERLDGVANGLDAHTDEVSFGVRLAFGGEHARTYPWIWGELGQRTLTDSARTLQGSTVSVRLGVERMISERLGLDLALRLGLSEYTKLNTRGTASRDLSTGRSRFARIEIGVDWRSAVRSAGEPG